MFITQYATKYRMINIINIMYNFILRIFKCCLLFIKIWMNGKIHIPINSCTQYTSSIFPIKICHVASSTAETYAKRCLCNNHIDFLSIIFKIPFLLSDNIEYYFQQFYSFLIDAISPYSQYYLQLYTRNLDVQSIIFL